MIQDSYANDRRELKTHKKTTINKNHKCHIMLMHAEINIVYSQITAHTTYTQINSVWCISLAPASSCYNEIAGLVPFTRKSAYHCAAQFGRKICISFL